MQIQELKNFNGGGMDQDSAPEFVAPNDYAAAWNVRNTGTSTEEAGYITNPESNEPISTTLPDGINKTIGAQGFEDLRRAYTFTFNSQNKGSIAEFDFDTEEYTTLFTNLDDSNGEDVLPIRVDTYIKDIKLIDGKYLLFLNGDGEPCEINVERLRDGGYMAVKKNDFLLIKAKPSKLITPVYRSDVSQYSNLCNGNLFQFMYQYEYLDNKLSAWSSFSKRVTPETSPTSDAKYNPSDNNCLELSVDIGTNRVVKVNVAARIGLGDWFLIKTVTREYATEIADTAINLAAGIREAYNGNTYSFLFYNNELYNTIDVVESDLQQDYTPLTAQTLELLNGNIVALGNITEGYDDIDINASMSVSYEDRGLSTGVPDDDNYLRTDGSAWRVNAVNSRLPQYGNRHTMGFFFKGNPKTGDKLTIRIKHKDTGDIRPFDYTVLADQEDDLLSVLSAFAEKIKKPLSEGGFQNAYKQSGAIIGDFYNDATYKRTGGFSGEYTLVTPSQVVYTGYILWFVALLDLRILDSSVTLVNAGSGVFKSESSIKLNSSEQFCLLYTDEHGRYGNALTNSNLVIRTDPYSITGGNTPVLNWVIGHTPPSWATGYHWGRSGNLTHQNWLYTTAKVQTGLPFDAEVNYLTLNITSLKLFNDKNGKETTTDNAYTGSVLSYDYTAGDRVSFHYYVNGPTINYLNSPAIDTEVVGFEIKKIADTDPDVSYLLKIRRTSTIDDELLTAITNKDILIEIYTPKKITKGDDNSTLGLFYEFGERYDIINGAHSVTSGTIRDGDCYIKTREMIRPTDDDDLDPYIVEDPNFSDFFESNFYSFGRPHLSTSASGQVNKSTSIRYSGEYVKGTNVNLTNRFYEERIYGTGAGEISSTYGAIKKLRQRDNVLICIQELHTGYIPVYTSILEDQESQRTLSISDKLLNQTRYSAGAKAGIGNAIESFAEDRNGTLFFIDPYQSIPIRAGLDGMRSVAGKMSKFFKKTLNLAYKEGKKIIGFYDNFNDEYIISVEGDGDVVQQYTFGTGTWVTEDDNEPTANAISIATPPTKGNVSYNTTTGIATYTPTINEFGSDNFTYTFGGVTKRACIMIENTSDNVSPFTLVDLIDKMPSTQHESNEISLFGNPYPVVVSISGGGGEYSINGGAWTSATGFMYDTDSIKVRLTASAFYGTTVSTALTLGNQSDTFSVTTVFVAWRVKADTAYCVQVPDDTPDAFIFTDQTGVALSTSITSNQITVSGIDSPAALSITVGEYELNNSGVWASSATTVTNGTLIRMRVTSSPNYSTTVSVELNIGGVIDTFSVTTMADPDPGPTAWRVKADTAYCVQA